MDASNLTNRRNSRRRKSIRFHLNAFIAVVCVTGILASGSFALVTHKSSAGIELLTADKVKWHDGPPIAWEARQKKSQVKGAGLVSPAARLPEVKQCPAPLPKRAEVPHAGCFG